MNSPAIEKQPEVVAQKNQFFRFLRKWALQIAITMVGILVYLFFYWRSPLAFGAYDIYNSLMMTTPFYAIMAIPLTLVIIAKEIDLSFISVMAWGMAVYNVVFIWTGNVYLGFIACLLAGLLAGLLNGLIVVRLGIPSLVATIGTQFFWRGAVLVVTNGQGSGMAAVQNTFLYPLLVGRIADKIPAAFVWTVIVGVITWFFLNRHKFGAHVYLTGDNEESARLMGINTRRTKILTFTAVGLAAAFSGFMYSAQVVFFWPTLGEGYLLNTLASVFLGGTSAFGGVGTIYGTFIAAFIIAVIDPGIVASGWLAYWTQLIYGLIIVVSVALQAVLRRRLT